MGIRSAFVQAAGKLLGAGTERRMVEAFSRVDGLVEQTRRLLDLPAPVWRTSRQWKRWTAQQAQEMAASLRQDGIVFIPNFLDAEQLARVRRALDAQFSPAPAPGMEFSESNAYYSSRQPLAICPEFAEAAMDADLIHLVGDYFRRTPLLYDADFRRVLPLDLAGHEREHATFAKGYSSSHWHHDTHGREIKVMIYLTDVGPDDQNFAYCLGSHTGFRSTRYEKSRFTEQTVEARRLKILDCYAPAGTAIAFDTNGIHRLRRRKTRTRDCVTFYYHPGRFGRATPQTIHPEALRRHREVLERYAILAGS